MKLESGSQIASYRVIGPLGSGGMGEVYRARDLKLDRDVALKVLVPDMASNKDHLRRFEQEARAASALNHPNIITIYEIGSQQDVSYIAMELVDGESLRDRMDRGPIPLAEALRIAAKVADGLAAAHERGIVHRDLKPENLMISRDGFVKVLDFGLAKLTLPGRTDGPTMPKTTPGVVFGTISYMSPEQARGRPVDGRSDQFSLAVILYEMLAGKRPFDRDSIGDTMAAIIRDEPAPIRSVNAEVPVDVETVIDNCLSKDREDRYESTRELAQELRDIRNRYTPGTDPGTASRRLPKPSRHARRKVPAAAIASIAAGLALLGAGGIFVARRVSGPPPDSQPKSVAIVPFRDASGTPEGQTFSDGISQTISARLAEVPMLKIFTPFDGAGAPVSADLAAVARHTGAKLMLEGSVQRAGEQLRVTYSLVETETGAQIGGRTVKGSVADLFTLEDTIADRILHNLGAGPVRKSQSQETGLQVPADQKAYTEAMGLLQKSRDEKAVDEATAKLEGLLANARDSAVVNTALARAYLSKHVMTRRAPFLDQARLYGERAVQLDATLPSAHAILGSIRYQSGNDGDAVAEFKRALVLAPRDVGAMIGLGSSYARMGRAADADRTFQQAIAARPDSANAFNRYGDFCLRRGQYDRAVRLFTRVTELLPDSSRGFTNLGAAYQFEGRYQDALRAYNRSLAIGATPIALSNVGACQYALGQYADASRSFEKATQLAPNMYLAWLDLGDAYRWTNDEKSKAPPAYKQAINVANASLGMNPKDALAHAVIATSLAKTGDLGGAAKAIDGALKIDPTNPSVLYQAAVISTIRNDRDSALLLLRRAVEAGYPASDAARDPELASLRNDPAFPKAISGPRSKT